MKILVVRGKNLASLAGDWEVDFTAPPLAKAGTIAITGPTGAGKSTLLDAICLALYGQTPRYHSAVRHRVGHAHDDDDEQLSSGDARGILRRGTGEGHAEVEFLARDGHAYRARWSVQRAHKRASGRLQNPVRSVASIATGQVIESGIDKVNNWIVDHLGLTLEQFTRSVLLPQGEFAAFLRADARERAGLLEKLTDTACYGLVGKLAYERAREALDLVRAEQEKLGEHRLLSEEQRAEVETEGAGAATEAEAAEKRAEQLEQQALWHARLAELSKLLGSAQGTVDAATAAHQAAAPRGQALAEIVAAEPLRPAIEQATRAAKLLFDATRVAAEAHDASLAARGEATRKAEARATAEAGVAEARAAIEAARPHLAEARRLDGTVAAQTTATANAREAASRRADERAGAETALVTAKADVAANKGRQAAAEAWLAQHPESGPLVTDWSLARASLAAFARHEAERVEQQGEGAARVTALEEAKGVYTGLDAKATELHGESQAKARQVEEAEAEAARHPLEASQAARVALEGRRLTSTQARHCLDNASKSERDAKDAASARVKHDAEALEQERLATEAEANAEAQAIALAEVEHLLRLARATVDVAAHRADLRAGEHCPLCGATEHPYADRPPVVNQLIADLGVRERELKRLESAARGEAKAAATRASTCRRLADDEAGREAKARAELAGLDQAWSGLGLGTALFPLEATEAALAADERELEQRERAVTEEERAASAAAKTAATARKAAQETVDAAAVARRDAEKAAGSVAACQKQVDDNARALRDAEAGVDAALRDLAEPLGAMGEWRGRLYADPRGFALQCAALVAERGQQEATIARCDRDGAALAATALATGNDLEQKTARCREAEGEHDARATELDGSRRERAALLDGRAVADVEAELDGCLRSRQLTLDDARGEAENADRAATSAEATATAESRASEAAGAEAALRAKARDAALAAAGIDLPVAEQRLAVARTWIEAEQAALAQLERDLHAADTHRRGRAQDLALHEATPRPEASAHEVATDLGQARAARDEARTRMGVLAQQLAEDDARRARVAEIVARVEALTAIYERRRALNELLGDATGTRFRTFVQSITLEVLVARANEQLARLAPRYRLGRAPGDSLALQVIDLDSASAIRPVSSLSGGETFLASLALALGLSSLAARDLRIGSLFIDEGFGTLDPKTLETVIELLESLQASGRQVGIITHVPGLADSLGAWVRVVKHTATQSRVVVGSGPLPM
ncbi:MAG: AAA family ATPase [Deltaproteobacteria bacterium]|nr:AAA family ATPase [Deltaproteobacteria bacterium]